MAAEPVLELNRQDLCPTTIKLCSWILETGVQAPEGYFYSWYDLETSAFVRPYPEITGYGISTLCWLFDLTGDTGLLVRARRASAFLTADAIHPDWSLVGTHRLSHLESLDRPVYLHSFDTGIVAVGLERLARRCRDLEIGDIQDRVADALTNRLLVEDGSVWPLVDLHTGAPTAGEERWSERFSGYHLKTLMFLMLGGASHDGRGHQSIVRRVVNRVLASQQDCGAFPSYADGETHLHPHLYTLEALTLAATAYDEGDWLEQAVAGYRYLENFITEQQGLPTRAHRERITVPFERADIVAQFLRLGSYLCSVGCVSQQRLDTALLWARQRLGQYVIEEGSHRGGVLFGHDWDGTFKRHLNCAVTLMSAQACHWYEGARSGMYLDVAELV